MTSPKFPHPWTVYLLSDVCTDYTWAYDSACAMKADDAALLLAELEAGTRYNLVHSRQVEYFIEAYPHQASRLIAAIRSGQITLNPVRSMTNFANMSLEEIVRSFYPARRLARTYHLDDHFANIQETPTASWILPTIFANIGVKHLVRSLLPYECPWARRLVEPPIYWWEGPDGSRVLVRLRKEDYVEGNFVLKGVETINEELHNRILPAYKERSDYPFDDIGLVGCYGDLSPQSKDFPAQKAAAIAAYHAQGQEFPRLVDASHADFWAVIDRQMAGGASVPAIRGDYGTSWEVWPVTLAADFAGYRRAQSRAALADRLSAILSILAPEQHVLRNTVLESAWDSLISLADHAWNGSSDQSRKLNASLRRQWQQAANAGFDAVIAESLHSLASRFSTQQECLLVFNHQSWPRTALARLEGEIPDSLTDLQTGASIPVQGVQEGGKLAGYCVIPAVPSVGCRVLAMNPNTAVPQAAVTAAHSQSRTVPISSRARDGLGVDSPFYRLRLDPRTGAVASLYDKTSQIELVDPGSPCCLNEALYTTAPAGAAPTYELFGHPNFEGAVEKTPTVVEIEQPVAGLVFDVIKAHSAIGEVQITSTYRLYHALDRLDIMNEVTKPISSLKEQLDFAFPFDIPQRQFRIETPGMILDPESDRLQGAGQSVHAVRRFVDVNNEDHGVTLAMFDSGFVQIGHRTTGEDSQSFDANATILCLALGDVYDWNEASHDQGGATQFVFRFSLQGHAGGFDPVSALHFGWDDPLEVVRLPAGQRGSLPGTAHSFVEVSSPEVVLTGMRAADEGGIALRLWETAGKTADVLVGIHGLGDLAEARLTDLLETDLEPLPVQNGKVLCHLPARGLMGFRANF